MGPWSVTTGYNILINIARIGKMRCCNIIGWMDNVNVFRYNYIQ